jgi:ubiquinone/menaquinone biosynthesis C-methylase UbiE
MGTMAETAVPSRAYDVPFEARAYQSYISGLKAYWGGELYREVVSSAEAANATSVDHLETVMRSDPGYQLYAWLERRTQQMRFHGRWGMATVLEGQRARLESLLRRAESIRPDRLSLEADFQLPDYVTGTDTHQLRGGLWREPFHAFVLAWYQTGLSFAGSSPDALVDWYASLLKRRLEGLALTPRRILDLGCTGGRSTRAIKRAMPAAEVHGCDVCEPSLRHGHLRSAEEGADVWLCQQNAEQLRFADGSFDVVASHWLFHEMPPRAIRACIAEAARVLRSGGVFAVYDMCVVPGGTIGEWLHSGYAIRNNEPFAHTLMQMDLQAELKKAGFTDVRVDLSSPDHPGPEIPERLPERRLHYMALVSGQRA